MWQPAGTVDVPGKGTFQQRFAPGAWDGQVGRRVPWTYEGDRIGTAVVVAAVVSDDGSGVTLTLDLEDGS